MNDSATAAMARGRFIEQHPGLAPGFNPTAIDTTTLLDLLDDELEAIAYVLNQHRGRAFTIAELATAVGAPETCVRMALAPIRTAERAPENTPFDGRSQLPIRHAEYDGREYYVWAEPPE